MKSLLFKVLHSFEIQAENGVRTKLPSRKNIMLLRHVEIVPRQPNSTGISDIATS
jgi:hypothetical protein